MAKTVILDAATTNNGDLSWDWLKEYGEVEVYERTPEELIFERSENADILITNKTPLRKEVLEKLGNLKFVAVLATGYNVVDTQYLKSVNIPVSNIPAYSTAAVAQLVFAHISELYNNVSLHCTDVKNGGWSNCPDFCYWKTPLVEMYSKTIGIIGFGKIGQAVADIAQAYQMNILAVSGHETDQSHRKNFKWSSIEEIAEKSDIVSLHCPLTDKTENLINEDFLSKMKPNAILINTARGQVVNEEALAKALNSGKIAGAGVDVLSCEPPKPDNPLLTAVNCNITPHIAWAGFETRQRLMGILKENIKAFFDSKPINVVNL